MRRRLRSAERGQSIIVVMSLVIVLSAVVAAALIYAGQDRKNAAKEIHNTSIQSMTETTLQFGRAFFSQNFPQTKNNVYLTYFSSTTNLTPAQVFHDHPELTPPNILGSSYDCFVYARDDDDEPVTTTPDPTTDNNQLIYVGAVCAGPGTPINNSVPAMPSGGFPQTAELTAPLIFDSPPQCAGCTTGGSNGGDTQLGGNTHQTNNSSQMGGYQ